MALDGVVRAQRGIRAGSRFPVRWTFAERAGWFQRLTVSVVGFEEVQVQRGTDRVTERSVFHRTVLCEGSSGFYQRVVTVSIPGDAPPSFQAPHSRIAWMPQEFAMMVEGAANS